MGKKSKRNRGGKEAGSATKTDAPALRQNKEAKEEVEIETKENLRFEDPYEDQYEEEDVYDDEEEPMKEDAEKVMTLNPYHATKEPMEMDPAAYKMHFSLRGEWPSLSFDFVKDSWGESRTRFPHQLLAVVGTQADEPRNNSVQLWKLSDLGKLPQEQDNDDDFDERDNDDDDDNGDEQQQENDDDDDEEEEEEDYDYDPVLEHSTVNHYGGVNRLRVRNGLVATWSDVGVVNMYRFEDLEVINDQTPKAPELVHSYKGHKTEGYAIDFSLQDRLASGDNQGAIHVWNGPQTQESMYQNQEQVSVEDIQWSPTETTVLAAGEAEGLIKIYDIRAPKRHMLEKRVSSTDVNALAWSNLVTNLLASGCDNGEWAVWDLRKLEDPLARFTPHTTPITSMEWHPTDESMLVVSDDVGSFVYDLSVEEDGVGSTNANDEPDLPPQLLFVHSGSPQTKEVHWHPQITSCLMSTAYDGFHIFMPSNL